MDRNAGPVPAYIINGFASLSARRAWIEIGFTVANIDVSCVALRKESVDRNYIGAAYIVADM